MHELCARPIIPSRFTARRRAGNPRARSTLIQLAWLWLRYQPGSDLSVWFCKRVGAVGGRTRRIAIVAPARKLLMELLEARGARADCHDPFVANIPVTWKHAPLAGRNSWPISPETLAPYDAVLICTDYDNVDYEALAASGAPVIDTRNVLAKLGLTAGNIYKA